MRFIFLTISYGHYLMKGPWDNSHHVLLKLKWCYCY